MRWLPMLHQTAGAAGSVYKILIIGCLIYELVKFRFSKTRVNKAARVTSRQQTPFGTA